MALPPDPLGEVGIAGFARDLRAGRLTAEAAARAYLDRIAALDPKIQSYEHVDRAGAIGAARAVDRLLAAGVDLGPLMGVPVGIKDIVAVDGMPTAAGSKVGVSDLVRGEGAFVRTLRRQGCVILGKTKTAEFAIGRGGANAVRGTPWNPHDARVHRCPGGSSSGSGAAMAAGLCGFAIGSDTGGSVRLPAALCGTAGLKTTKGRWPTDGAFPLAPTLDTLGVLTRTAADAAHVFAAIEGIGAIEPTSLRGVRLGVPKDWLAKLEAEVAAAFAEAAKAAERAGAEVREIDLPEAAETAAIFAALVPAELVAGLGRARAEASLAAVDPVSALQVRAGLSMPVERYIRARWDHLRLVRTIGKRFDGLDAWLTPACWCLAPPLEDVVNPPAGKDLPTFGDYAWHANVFGLCAVNMAVAAPGAALPASIQLVGRGGAEARILALAAALERILPAPPAPDLAAFAR